MSAAQIAKADLVAMDKIWDNGFRQITTSTKPIMTPDDLKGFKIRVPVSPLWTSMFKAFGCGADQHQLQRDLLRRCRPRWSTARRTRWRSSPPPSSTRCRSTARMTNHMWDGFWMLANRRAWEACRRTSQADRRRKHIERRRAEAARRHRQAQRLAAGRPASKGMKFNEPTPAPSATKLREAGFYAEWKSKLRRRSLGACSRSAAGKLADHGRDAQSRATTARSRQAGVVHARPAAHALGDAVRARRRPALGQRRRRRRRARRAAGRRRDRASCSPASSPRYVLHRPLVWSDELASILFLWLAMLGAVVALRRGEHMRMTALVGKLAPARRGPSSRRSPSPPLVAFLLLIASAGARLRARRSASSPRRRWRSPNTWRAAALPVGIGLMLLVGRAAAAARRHRRADALGAVALIGRDRRGASGSPGPRFKRSAISTSSSSSSAWSRPPCSPACRSPSRFGARDVRLSRADHARADHGDGRPDGRGHVRTHPARRAAVRLPRPADRDDRHGAGHGRTSSRACSAMCAAGCPTC